MAVLRGRVVRVEGDGRPHVEVPDLGGPGFSFGPCESAVLGLTVGERVLVASVGVPDSVVVIGTLQPSAPAGGYTDAQIDAMLADRVPLTRLITAGVGLTGGGDLSADRTLTVSFAPAGVVSATQAVRADDPRLSDDRTPVVHTHDDRYYTEAEADARFTLLTDPRLSDARQPTAHSHAIGDLPVAASGVVSAAQVVRADDSRLSDARTPTAHTHDDRYFTEAEADARFQGVIAAGTTAQYWRGDKTWQTLDKAAVGLGNVANVDTTNASNITTGMLPSSVLPSVAITDTFEVASQAAMLALAAQRGDVAIRSDLNKSFILATDSPGTLADWKELRTPTDAVLSVAGKTGAVTLVKGDVGLGNVDNTSDAAKPVSTATQTALDGKAATVHVHAAGDVTSGVFSIARIPTGTTASTVAVGNDPRLSDARTPTAHTHGVADLTATGTRDATTFLRGDNTWAPPSQTPQAAIIGQITLMGTVAAPYGWLVCDGAEYPIATYGQLYNVLTSNGTVFPFGANTDGNGNAGSTHFRVPDLKGRVPVGRDASQVEFDVFGESGGSKTATLSIAQLPQHDHSITHSHTASTAGGEGGVDHLHYNDTGFSGGHEHTYSGRRGNRVVTGGGAATVTDSAEGSWGTTGGGGHSHAFWSGAADRSLNHGHTITVSGTTVARSGMTGSSPDPSHANLQPYLTLSFMIRAFETMTPVGEVMVPSRLDDVSVPTVPFSFNGQRLTNLGTPTAASDGATKAYVDGMLADAAPPALGVAAVGVSPQAAREDHVHPMPTLTQVGAPTADRAMGGFKITGLADPAAAQDAATKAYVDAKSTSGYTTSVTPALVAHTWSANITHSLNVTGVAVSVYEVSTGENVDLDWKRVDANNIQLRAGVAMAANSYVLYVTGR